MADSWSGSGGRAAVGGAWPLGLAATSALALVLLAWATTVDFARVSYGFFSDGATYYSLAHSLAEDGDFEYRRDDLVRVWHDFPSGPEGIFLKKGKDVALRLDRAFPFIRLEVADDPDQYRLYYGKSFIFPLFAAPFVAVFGTNGFLVLHAVLMTLCFACAYAFLAARSSPTAALLFAAAFLLVSVAPVYMVWMTPDFFNLAMVLFGYFFWTYKEVAGARFGTSRLATVWLLGPRSDIVAAVFLGLATFSRPTHVLLAGPVLALPLIRRQWMRALLVAACFTLVVVGLFAWNVAITGEWNYQGGERRTFYSSGGFPFQTERDLFAATTGEHATNRVPTEVLVSRDALLRVFPDNLINFLLGRHTAFVAYYFPGFLAALLFLVSPRGRPLWQWLTLAAGVGSAVALLLYMPFTYSGGGAPVGNRYFLGVYPVFLFLVPPLARIGAGLVATGGSALFTAQLITNPFYVSFHPAEHTKHGPFRWLPVERTLVNDLPVNISASRVRQPLGGTPPISAYFLDDNAYAREKDAFWVRGGSRADLLLRAPVVTACETGGDVVRPLRVSRMEVDLETGPVPNRVTITTGAGTQVVELPASHRQQVVVDMGDGLPYRPYPDFPANYVYAISIANESSFIPLFVSGSRDNRVLGVFVRLVPVYE
ncbi:MAG: hypothetical protein ABR606_10850 [Vicinamibacterales bacterium]